MKLLERGAVIGVFPEGTSLPDRKRGYKRGAARLALATGAPLIPVALIGTHLTLEPRTHRIRLPRVRIVIGEPLRVERQEPTAEAATELTARLQQRDRVAPGRRLLALFSAARCDPFRMATRLLVVDDDRAVRESLRRALTLEGYEVELAEDGADGLARVAGADPDAIVLDVAMPVVDGIEMCRRLRHDGSACPSSCSRRVSR